MTNLEKIERYCAHDWIISLTEQEDCEGLDRVINEAFETMMPHFSYCIFVDKEFGLTRNYKAIKAMECGSSFNERDIDFICSKIVYRKLVVTQFRGAQVSIIPIYHCEQLLGFALINAALTHELACIFLSVLTIYGNQLSMIHRNMLDPFTGLYNRQTFDKKLIEIVSGNGFLSPREFDPDSHNWFLALIDIDFFKRVNDLFGHTIGDEVILLIAQIFKRSVRTQDYVFRYGGEEFAILFCGTSLLHAKEVLERIRFEVASYTFPQAGKVTISIGLTEFKSGYSPKRLIEHADRALYQSKDHGRNRLTIIESDDDDFAGSVELF